MSTLSEYMIEFHTAYLETALWSSTDENDVPFDRDYDVHDIASESGVAAMRECLDFVTANKEDLLDLDPADGGHNFWLSRNGHGAGFFDRGLGDLGDRLHSAARVYGTVDVYRGDDDRIWFS